MNHRPLPLFLLIWLALCLIAPPSFAQNYRAEKSPYLLGRVGLNTYGGDRDDNPDNELSEYVDNIGFSLGVEFGYHVSKRFSVGLMHLSGNYPKVSDPRPEINPPLFQEIDEANSSDWRHHLNLLGRLNLIPDKRANPYLHAGLGLGFGKINDNIEVGYGPVAGLGLDVAVTDQVGLFLETTTMLMFPDEALDQADPTKYDPSTSDDDVSAFDAFNFYGLGLRFNFRPAFTPVMVLALDCPETLNVGETGTFTATVNEDATPPVEYSWNFGDNMAAPGLLASHSYDQAGSYTVNFTADNGGSTDAASCVVRVIAPASVTTITSNRTEIDTCEPLVPVQFNANVRGTAPITYTWDFGDGTTGTGANPSHAYSEAGTYTVTLTVQNAAGTDTRTYEVTVDPCAPLCDITEMNSVFFDRNSSVLTSEARLALQENLEIFLDCPDIHADIQGFASSGERNARQLAMDRARAVLQYYLDGGVSGDRFTTSGSVLRESKKDASQLRRADTIPRLAEIEDADADN